jgi:DNA invertase Pin-like site-specific DNA recombinase
MNVFAYYRVSSWEQEDKTGLPRQQEVVAKFAASNQMVIIREFSEVQSGGVTYEDRAMLAAMLDEARTAGADAIIVERIDRLARDLMAQEVFLRSATAKGIKVFTADSGQDMTNTDDPTRVMFRQVMGALAQWEKAVIVKKLQDGRRRTVERTGQPCGGPPRYGFHPDPKVRAHQRDIIASIKRARTEGFSYAQIAGSMQARGIVPPAGRIWHRATVYKLSKVNLDNPAEGGTS